MNRILSKTFIAGLVLLLEISPGLFAQSVTLPRASQKVVTTQTIGLSTIEIDYSAPRVNDREVWGKLVPMDQVWRAGANENTTITFSHDVKVEGKVLPAATYGLHMIPSEGEWTVIFSKNHTSWGSFSYQESEDALRVEVSPAENQFTEYLTFRFLEPTANSVTVALQWEKLSVGFDVEVDVHEIVLANIRNELRSTAGFSWMGFQQAANYCLQNEINYDEALEWIDQSISGGFGAQENYTNLQTKAGLLEEVGKKEEAEKTMDRALNVASGLELYQYGATLIGQGKNKEAMEIFQFSAGRFPDTWLTHAGLAAGNRVNGNNKEALKHYKKAKEGAPAIWQPSLQQRIDQVTEALNTSKNR